MHFILDDSFKAYVSVLVTSLEGMVKAKLFQALLVYIWVIIKLHLVFFSLSDFFVIRLPKDLLLDLIKRV